jgi:hypothetical protein
VLGVAVQVELLLVEECPHADAARTLLAGSLRALGLEVPVAERVGDYPSPTILIDGVDVMTGEIGAARIHACRLDVPTAEAVTAALRTARAATVDPDAYPPQLAVGVTRDRITRVSPAARVLHREILRGFATTGQAPEPAQLAATSAAGGDLATLLAELHDHDVIRLDERGQIRAAYPFSAVPTTHVVAIDGGPTVYAMCAIDALGVADMLDRDIAITSADPMSGNDIRVTITGRKAAWTPDTAVVFVGSDSTAQSAGGDCCRAEAEQPCTVPAADRCCGVMNFFTGPDSANAWQAAHPEVTGVILSQGQALRLGADIFGPLLDKHS